MKKNLLPWLIVILLGLALLGMAFQYTHAKGLNHGVIYSAVNPTAAVTLIPTSEPVILGYPTPEKRVLPPVGSNAGLVIGATVLVLIIIGGVLSARMRPKH